MYNQNQNQNIIDFKEYSQNFYDWDEIKAIQLAQSEGIKLNLIHWEVIKFVRMFYKEYQMFPKIRTIINIISLKHGPNKGNSRYLIKLFPRKSVIQQIAKIAGLPKPSKCV